MMGWTWLLPIVVGLAAVRYGAATAGYCDAACQSQQEQALLSLFNSTGGPTWHSTLPGAISAGFTRWANTTASRAGFPAHCTWYVLLLLPQALLLLLSQVQSPL